MQEKLLEIINQFENSLTTIYQKNQHIPKLKTYLVKYLVNKYQNLDLHMLFTNEFTRKDIIDSTIFYIEENINIRNLSAIDDFLIALNKFFNNIVFKKYNNQNVRNLYPFTSLKDDINKELISRGIKLHKREPYPSIGEDEYNFILEYLKGYSGTRLQSYQLPIVIKLMLLYGFSFDKLADLKKENYNIEKNILKIVNTEDIRQEFLLELPFSFLKEFEILFEFRKNHKRNLNNEFLFLTEENNKINSGTIHDFLDKIKKEFEKVEEIKFEKKKNPFTATGLQKFAIINMILTGVNESIITDLTGQKDEILSYCQLKVSEKNVIHLNRYINSKIRNLHAYDDFLANEKTYGIEENAK